MRTTADGLQPNTAPAETPVSDTAASKRTGSDSRLVFRLSHLPRPPADRQFTGRGFLPLHDPNAP